MPGPLTDLVLQRLASSAECRGTETDRFYDGRRWQMIRRYCDYCPVRMECQYELLCQPRWRWAGVWAGRDAGEWRRIVPDDAMQAARRRMIGAYLAESVPA